MDAAYAEDEAAAESHSSTEEGSEEVHIAHSDAELQEERYTSLIIE